MPRIVWSNRTTPVGELHTDVVLFAGEWPLPVPSWKTIPAHHLCHACLELPPQTSGWAGHRQQGIESLGSHRAVTAGPRGQCLYTQKHPGMHRGERGLSSSEEGAPGALGGLAGDTVLCSSGPRGRRGHVGRPRARRRVPSRRQRAHARPAWLTAAAICLFQAAFQR